MKILHLTLENFRGIRNLEIDFGDSETNIYGANGTGKTTVANAVSWLLFGKAATGEKDFDPKTAGAHDLHHTATAKFERDDGAIVTLKKDFFEVWSKKKGAKEKTFSGNTTDYWIDGIPHKESAYTRAVQRMCGGTLEAAKMLTMYDYFPAVMLPDDRRKVLFDVCGDLSDEDVIKANPDLKGIHKYLLVPGTDGQMYQIDEYRKIATERRRKINHDLELLPARIDEASKSIPDTLPDADAINKDIADLQSQASAIDEEMANASVDSVKQSLLQEIAKLKTTLEKHRSMFDAKQNEKFAEQYSAIDIVRKKVSEISGLIQRTKNDLVSANSQYENTVAKRESLLKEFASVQKQQWDPSQENCPTCGQPLPADKVQALREGFNLNKSRTLEEINRRGQSCSQSVIQKMAGKCKDLTDRLDQYRIDHTAAQEELASISKNLDNKRSYDDTYDCKEIEAKLDELKTKMAGASSVSDEYTDDKKLEKDKIMAAIREKNADLAVIDMAAKTQARIQELEDEQRNSGAALEDVEHGLYLCDEFVKAKVRMVTDNINSRFHMVRFKLFDDQLNGGIRERCEPMIQNAAGEWVEYRSANTAAQVNAGIDIIGVLSEHYGIHLPVFIDRAESVTHIDNADDLQIIRLVVSANDSVLRITNN